MCSNDNYAMLHYSNLNYTQYKPSSMHYTVTYHHDTSCFLISGSPLIRIASHGHRISDILQIQLHYYQS